MQIGHEQMAALRRQDRGRTRRRFLLSLLLLAALCFLFLCLRTTRIGFLSPWQTLSNLAAAARLELAKWLKWSIYDQRLAIIQGQEGYLETLSRLQGAVLAMVLGAVLSAAGVAFQCVFRNPIAVPTMLGVSSGISAANFLLVLQYSTLAVTMTQQRFLYGYGCSLALLGVILLVGKAAERDRASVSDILLVGTALSRIVSQTVSGLQYALMDESDYLLLQEMRLYGTGLGNTRGAVFLALALLAGLVPLLLIRYSLNVTVFPDEEAQALGLRAGRLRLLALVCSTILVVAAQIHCGDVALLALLVPHLCRHIVGANTRELLPASLIYGALLMLVCRFVVSLFAFDQYLSVISVGMLVDLVSMPLMIVTLLRHRRGWE